DRARAAPSTAAPDRPRCPPAGPRPGSRGGEPDPRAALGHVSAGGHHDLPPGDGSGRGGAVPRRPTSRCAGGPLPDRRGLRRHRRRPRVPDPRQATPHALAGRGPDPLGDRARADLPL
ncbi:MAG: hypothetical protein AVDCRST_MAG60-1793, partial [uncultured Nocardioides sp.]